MICAGVAERAVSDLDLFVRVVTHRQTFFPFSWTDDDTMARGSLRIVPEGSLVATWEADYRAMKEAMFSGQPPEFGEILRVVGEFERTFNEVHSAEQPEPQDQP